ncbi:translation initiation factor IF-2-like [Equus quagga]|uniref:translation initiation factor IF-2-like n=1 Tax=Equus quagga TaxID=89248 RepID=UPI001EE2AAF7|nr:translation initiation factor IF-2-like [Equus quagga]
MGDDGNPSPPILTGETCGLEGGWGEAQRLQGPTPAHRFPPTPAVRSKTPRPQPLPAPSRRPRLRGLGTRGRTRLRGPGPLYRVRPPRRGPPAARARGASAKGAARAAREDGARRATAPPALARGQAQRHLSAFQPPPHPQIRSRGGPGGANRIGPAPSRPKQGRPGPSSLRAGRAGSAEGARPGRVLRAAPRLIRARPRVLGGAPGPGGEGGGGAGARREPGRAGSAGPSCARRGRPQERRAGGSQEEQAARAPPPPAHRSPPPPEPRGPFCREERKRDSHPRASGREKKRGGENRGEEIGKAYFSSAPAVTRALPAPCSRPRRAPLPPSRLPAAPGGGRHTRWRTQLILNRLNQ